MILYRRKVLSLKFLFICFISLSSYGLYYIWKNYDSSLLDIYEEMNRETLEEHRVLASYELQSPIEAEEWTQKQEAVFEEVTAEDFQEIRYLDHIVEATKINSRRLLDSLFNMTRVDYVDLHNTTFLDCYYYYNYEAIEERMTKRMEQISEVCRKTGYKNFPQTYCHNLYQFNEASITWCPVFKGGSTTWRNYFIDRFVQNKPSEKNRYELNNLRSRQLTTGQRANKARGETRQEYKIENGDNTRFMVVRHPYFRLVSHQKKMQLPNHVYMFRGIWMLAAMERGRRKKISATLQGKYKSEFNSYVDWLHDHDPAKEEYSHSEDNPYFDPPYPDLSEMVDAIYHARKKGNDWEGHWMPANEFCNICSNQFKYVALLEEEPLELWYITDKLGLWADRAVFLSHENRSHKHTETDDVWDFIEALPQERRQFLEKHFDIDFQMFGYARSRQS